MVVVTQQAIGAGPFGSVAGRARGAAETREVAIAVARRGGNVAAAAGLARIRRDQMRRMREPGEPGCSRRVRNPPPDRPTGVEPVALGAHPRRVRCGELGERRAERRGRDLGSVGRARGQLQPGGQERVGVSARQWLVYRSLFRGKRSITVLGQNLVAEFTAARFLKTGELDELIEIEPSDEA